MTYSIPVFLIPALICAEVSLKHAGVSTILLVNIHFRLKLTIIQICCYNDISHVSLEGKTNWLGLTF